MGRPVTSPCRPHPLSTTDADFEGDAHNVTQGSYFDRSSAILSSKEAFGNFVDLGVGTDWHVLRQRTASICCRVAGGSSNDLRNAFVRDHR